MKFTIGLAVLFSVVALGLAESCDKTLAENEIPTAWTQTMQNKCSKKTQSQIKAEIGASNVYLMIAAHFSRDTVNRPGFAEFFFKAAREEREHAIQLIEYLSMRGHLLQGLSSLTVGENLTNLGISQAKEWNGIEALKTALELETRVTGLIRDLIMECEADTKANNDYHFVDYLTGVYLEEQHKGQRDIAGKLATLQKMYDAHGKELAEFLFDKEL